MNGFANNRSNFVALRARVYSLAFARGWSAGSRFRGRRGWSPFLARYVSEDLVIVFTFYTSVRVILDELKTTILREMLLQLLNMHL